MDKGPDLIGATVGQYQIEALIGHGGMGYVYRARDAVLARSVALKILPPDVVNDASRLARFMQEARAASALNHPHVIAIYEIREAAPTRDGQPIPGLGSLHYMAMELVAGDTLRMLIEHRRLDVKRGIDVLVQVAEALAAAHAAGVVHRDLKPENIMLAASGYAKVLDFGLAKLRPDMPGHDGVTQAVTMTSASAPGMLLGTVGYMSPEQVEGRPTDHRSDVFSFGCVAYEVVSGSRAFAGPSTIETLHRIANVDATTIVQALASAPAELRRIIGKCLAKSPDERYQSMTETAIDLRGLLRSMESDALLGARLEGRAAENPRQPDGAPKWLWVAGAAAILAIVAAVASMYLGRAPAVTVAPTQIAISRITASGFLTHVALSPDGKYLAYTDNPGGRQSLWIRQLDGTNPLELIGPRPVGYWGVAFARDGASIFYAVKGQDDPGGSIYQIPFLGGPSRKIVTDVDSPPALSPDGKQIAYLRADYPERSSSALMVAGIDGSNPRPLAVRRAPEFFAPGQFISASWSPDGTRLVAPVRNTQTRQTMMVTIGLAGDAAPLGEPVTEIGFTHWLPEGVVFIARGMGGLATGGGGQVWLQPYPRGTPRRLTNDLVDYRSSSASADGKSIISVGLDANPVLWTIPLDGHGEPQRLKSLRYDGTFGVSWSVDGQVMFTSPLRGALQIWAMNLDGSNRRPMTTEGSNGWPSLSRDGSFVAFSGFRGDQRGVWRMNPDGSDQRLLASVANASFLDTTPDSQWITFTTDQEGALSLWRVASGGGTPELLIDRLDRGSLAPDGQRAFGVYTEGSRYDAAVLPLAGGAPMWVPSERSAATGGNGIFKWAPDGKSVYFTTAERMNVFSYRFGDAAQTKLTNFSDAIILNGALSRDGRALLVSRGAQARDAYLITDFH